MFFYYIIKNLFTVYEWKLPLTFEALRLARRTKYVVLEQKLIKDK